MTELKDHIILTAAPDADLRERWEEFLLDAEMPTQYVTPDFFDDPFAGTDRFAVIAFNGGRIAAVMTGTYTGGKLVSGLGVRPQTCFRHGADRLTAAVALMHGLREMGGRGLELIRFFTWERIEGLEQLGFRNEQVDGNDRTIMINLAKGPDQIFRDFSERRRTQIRKVMRSGKLVVKMLETEDETAQLYAIHCDWNRRKQLSPQPLHAFRQIRGSKYRVTFIAVSDGQVIAGTYLRFCPNGVIEYAANNSLEEHLDLRPNELLAWRSIEWACENGFKVYSLGGSHPFLARFGGDVHASHRYEMDLTTFKRHLNRERVLRFASRTYFALPDPIRRRIRRTAEHA